MTSLDNVVSPRNQRKTAFISSLGKLGLSSATPLPS